MGRFVLALHDAGGTVPPMLAIAQALTMRGHSVTVLGQPGIERRARRAGCDFVAFAIENYATDLPIEEQTGPVMTMMTGRAPGEELLRTIEIADADVVVVDANLAGVAAAAEVAECRSAILLHSLYKTYVDTWFGEFWPFLAPMINETRAGYGLAPCASWTEIFEAHDRVYAAVPRIFDAAASRPPPTTMRHTGFLVPTTAGSDVAFEGNAELPIVLVSLSTTDMGQGPLLQTILDSLDGQAVRGVVTTGRQRVGAGLRVPTNVTLHDFLPHAAVLPHTRAVITHAGLGTVAAALSHAVPLVCTPIARDQPLNAAQVAGIGAGLTTPAAGATPDGVRDALHEVLADSRFREAASSLAAENAQAGGASGAADDLEHLSR